MRVQDLAPQLQQLNTGHPLCPDWMTVAGQSGSYGLARSLYKNPRYNSNARAAGSDISYDTGRGWRFVNTSSADSAVVSRVQFDNVGKYSDGDFTMAAFCTPEDGTEVNAWVMSIGKTSSQQPAIGIGWYGSLGRRMISWDGTAQYTGSNDDIVWGDPYFVALRYDSAADTLQGRWFNLNDGTVLTYNLTSKTWPSNVQTSLSLGGHHRSTVYYDPMEGVLERAMYWDRQIDDNDLYYIARHPAEFLTAKIYSFPTASGAAAALTGTITSSADESDIVAGGKTAIITLTNDTWVAAGATFDAQRQNIIDGFDAAASPTNGWNNEVRDKEAVTAVVRTSDTVVTVTFTASASYDITSTETITCTVPATALVTSAVDVTATPTFTVDAVSALATGTLGLLGVGI